MLDKTCLKVCWLITLKFFPDNPNITSSFSWDNPNMTSKNNKYVSDSKFWCCLVLLSLGRQIQLKSNGAWTERIFSSLSKIRICLFGTNLYLFWTIYFHVFGVNLEGKCNIYWRIQNNWKKNIEWAMSKNKSKPFTLFCTIPHSTYNITLNI